jgi:hypothetical protein
MSATPAASMPVVSEVHQRSKFLLAGPKFPLLFLTALPAAVVALSSDGHPQQVSAFIALGWFTLVPVALYDRWVALALPVVSAGFLVLSLAALPFGSPALIVDVCTSVAMFVLSLPRHRRDLPVRRPSV